MLPDSTAPISLIPRQYVWLHIETYFYNSLPFFIKIKRLVDGAHKCPGGKCAGVSVQGVNVYGSICSGDTGPGDTRVYVLEPL